MPRPQPSDMQDGVRIPKNVWYAEIVNKKDSEANRKIRVCALTRDRAVRSAREFCCPGEFVNVLYDKEMKPVWSFIDAAPDPKKKSRRRK